MARSCSCNCHSSDNSSAINEHPWSFESEWQAFFYRSFDAYPIGHFNTVRYIHLINKQKIHFLSCRSQFFSTFVENLKNLQKTSNKFHKILIFKINLFHFICLVYRKSCSENTPTCTFWLFLSKLWTVKRHNFSNVQSLSINYNSK